MLAVRHKDSTETRILDAARDSIIAVGWKRTTLTEVARRAGLSRMTVYRRYPDAVAIYADLMTREWADQAPTGVDSVDTTAHGIAALIAERLDILGHDPLFQRLIELDPDLLLPYLTERRGRTQQAILTLLVPHRARPKGADHQAGLGRASGSLHPARRPGLPCLVADHD